MVGCEYGEPGLGAVVPGSSEPARPGGLAHPVLFAKESTSRPVSRVLCLDAPLARGVRDGHSSGARVAPRLEQPTRAAGLKTGFACRVSYAGRPYLVLLPVGFTVPLLSPGARCALTAPFHPCRLGRGPAGGLFSVALSLGSPPAAVGRHRVSAEPGLSSPAEGRKATGSGRPAGWCGA